MIEMMFDDNEYQLYKTISGLTQSELKRSLYKVLKKQFHYDRVVKSEKYLFAEGDVPIALVAHLDTVHKTAPIIFFDKEQDCLWSPTGLGADDRAGVFAILAILEDGYRPHVIFTTDEEVGGLGAMDLANRGCPFLDLRYIVELDRQGRNDSVFYECGNDSFEEYINSFGFETGFGSFSDISFICPSWEVAGVNLSVGYYNEHTKAEFLFSSQLKTTIKKVEMMLEEEIEDIPSFEYIMNVAYMEKCAQCGKPVHWLTSIPVKGEDGKILTLCDECLSKDNIHWCAKCNSPYIEKDITKLHGLCHQCRKKVGI